MGTKRFGDNIQLFVKNAAGEEYGKPDGQGNLTINRSGSEIDTSDKNTGQYGTSAPGQQALTITQAIQPSLPDAAYTRMKTLSKTLGAVATYQVRDITVNGAAGILFEADMFTSFGNTDAPQKGVVATTVTLSLAAAPTKDDL